MSGTYLTNMADVLRAAGVAVVEQDGWRTRARSSGGYSAGRPWCVMWHHTASSANASAASDANYMSYSADSKPIANILLARDGTAWVLAAGATNTNGKGDACSFSKGTVPADSMNLYAIGMEIQNNGVGQAYSQQQIDAAFKVSLALCQAYGLRPDDVQQHVNYAPGRKIDPATAAAVEGPWRPRSTNSSGSWAIDDLKAELRRRAGSTPPQPQPIPDEEDEYDVAFIIINQDTGQPALVYGEGKMTGIDGTSFDAFVGKFGPAIVVEAGTFNDFEAKSRQ